jgi:hypothetical protein
LLCGHSISLNPQQPQNISEIARAEAQSGSGRDPNHSRSYRVWDLAVLTHAGPAVTAPT